LPSASFDAITLWHVLEHVHDLQGYMAQLKNLLKENGRLFIAVPNYTSKDAAIYKEDWAAWDVPRHLYHFSPRSMKTLVEKHGLKIVEYKPMWFDSFYVSMLSSKYRNGRTNLVASFLNGLRSNIKAMGNVQRCSSVIYIIGKSPQIPPKEGL
jgi:SAM-dependent methyltransferase